MTMTILGTTFWPPCLRLRPTLLILLKQVLRGPMQVSKMSKT